MVVLRIGGPGSGGVARGICNIYLRVVVSSSSITACIELETSESYFPPFFYPPGPLALRAGLIITRFVSRVTSN